MSLYESIAYDIVPVVLVLCQQLLSIYRFNLPIYGQNFSCRVVPMKAEGLLLPCFGELLAPLRIEKDLAQTSRDIENIVRTDQLRRVADSFD